LHQLSGLDQGLLRQAFTHSSTGEKNNERLEFLGDAILDSIISEYLYIGMPEAQEHYLTRLRAYLVNKNALADIGTKLELSKYLILGEGERQTGGHKRDSNLADAFEALIAAIFLSLGYEPTKEFILKVYVEWLNNLPSEASLKDSKTRLQEFLQKNSFALPEYEIISEQGKPHNKTFVVRGTALDISEQAKGKSRKEAEQRVAELLFIKLQKRS